MEKNFVKETKSELKKVIWPNRQQVASGTGVVIAMVVLVGIIIFAFDSLSVLAVNKIRQIDVSPKSDNIGVVEDIVSNNANEVTDGTDNNVEVIPDSSINNGDQTAVVEDGSVE